MLVTLNLEHPHSHYTNLDIINGRVSLSVPHPGNISSIVVKLEGESKTRLLAPVRPDRRERQPKPVLEVHKILYKTQVVWPANQTEETVAGSKAGYTINAGQYEYPFSFKIPLNNACRQTNGLTNNVSFTGMSLEVAKAPTQHVKQTLPPSLTGFPGEAEIRYYVKVTVNLPQFYKENPRAIANFTFLPIEPPRPAQLDGEAYARRQHQFVETVAQGKKKAGFFTKFGGSSTSLGTSLGTPTSPTSPNSPHPGGILPRFTVDARLPNPAILMCAQDLPLRILVKNMGERDKNVYLQMLQIELIGYTKVRAQEVERTESNSWIIASFSNMAIPIGSPSDPIGTETPINQEYWSDKPLQNTIAPTFQTCNISRFYELEVRVGLGYGSYKHGEDQLVVLPLRLPVKVYSGIKPPNELLQAAVPSEANKLSKPTLPGGKPGPATLGVPPQLPQRPITPVEHPGFLSAQAHPQAQSSMHLPTGPDEPPPGDAPPSYEDAIGQDLPPIHGYRGSYQTPPTPADAPRFPDEKRG